GAAGFAGSRRQQPVAGEQLLLVPGLLELGRIELLLARRLLGAMPTGLDLVPHLLQLDAARVRLLVRPLGSPLGDARVVLRAGPLHAPVVLELGLFLPPVGCF